MGSTAKDVLQYGALGLLALAIVGLGYLAAKSGRAIWTTVETFFTGLLAEFRRSNDNAIALHGKLDTTSERSAREHEQTRAELRNAASSIVREVHGAREIIEQTVRERISDAKDLIRTGEHMAVSVDMPPPPSTPVPPQRRSPTNPRLPVSPQGR